MLLHPLFGITSPGLLTLIDMIMSMPRRLVWITFGILFILHHDFWWWDDRTLVLGVVPIGLAYHACFSVAAALLWAAATRFAWPDEIEAWAAEGEASGNAADARETHS